MLVLSRTPGEAIIIGTDVVLTVLEVRGNTVRLGIDAPRDITINRAELTTVAPSPLNATPPSPRH